MRIETFGDVIRYLPRGLFTLLLDPMPWYDRSDPATGTLHDFHGRSGSFRQFASLEMLALYCLYPALFVVIRTSWSSRDNRLWLILGVIVPLGTALAIVMPNVGTLFRLRGQLIVPLIVLIAATEGFAMYRRGWRLLRRKVATPREASSTP